MVVPLVELLTWLLLSLFGTGRDITRKTMTIFMMLTSITQAFLFLYVEDNIDLEHFLEDFEYIKPAGTKWYIIPVTVGQLDVGDIAIDNAYLVIDTMTYKTEDESLSLSDTFIDEEKNTQQPGVEPVVLT